jgi:activating signal cointegrator 1
MKAISLWQPWASAIAFGSKRVETRSWSTSYRGPLAIHAAKRVNKGELLAYASDPQWCGALGRSRNAPPIWKTIPFGAIVAVANLVDCRPTETFAIGEIDALRHPDFIATNLDCEYGWTERDMGDFTPGRFGWALANIRALREPIPYRGAQGLFDIPDGLLVESHCCGRGPYKS